MASPQQALETLSTLRSRRAESCARTDALFRLLRPDALFDRLIPERHRLIFYLGHLEAFDWNLLGRGALELASFRPEFDRLFAFGIDPVDGKLPDDRPSDWPGVAEIEKYNATVREKLDAQLSGPPIAALGAEGTLLHVAIEHRLMHAETLAYLLHQLPCEKKLGPREPLPASSRNIVACMVRIPEGEATLGLARQSGAFGWDNEFEAHTVPAPSFSIRAFPVTNGEFLEFVRAGGYTERSLWSAEAQEWKTASGISHPLFWQRRSEDWEYRGMFARFPLPLDWPVYVSHAEAQAFARWAGQSLPSEAQWHRAAYGAPSGSERPFPWGDAPPSAKRGNFDFLRWDAAPVDAHPGCQSAFGVFDLLGNGWEWTATPFAPFPGFQPLAFYPGYSANFFDGKHYVMKGGSPLTAACMLRRSFRNWFQPHYPYVYAAFRTVEE